MEWLKIKRSLKFKLPLDNRLVSLLKYLREIKNYVAFVCIEGNYKSLKKLHKAVYRRIRQNYPFIPSRYIIDVEREVLSVMKAIRRSKAKFKGFKKLSVWLVKGQSLKFDWERIEILYQAFGGGRKGVWLTFSIKKDKRFLKYKDWNFKEARLKYDGELWLYVIFEKEVEQKVVRGYLAVDINFNNVTLSNGRRMLYDLSRAIEMQEEIEKIMRKYNKQWSKNKGILRAIRRRWKNIRNYVNDIAWKVANFVCSYGFGIVLEDLNGLKEEMANLNKSARKRLNFFAYRKIQKAIEIKAEEYGLKVFYVDARRTSVICPRCEGITKMISWKLLKCKKCGKRWDRDRLAALNILRKFNQMRSKMSVDAPLTLWGSASNLDENPMGMRRR